MAGPLMVSSMPFLDVFDYCDGLDGIGDLGRPLLEQARVFREEFDLDGIGRAGKIADLVLQNLVEISIELRKALVDLAAQVCDDFIDAAFSIALELDQKVSAVGFGHGSEAQLQAGAPRSAFNFGYFADDLFDFKQGIVGVFE